MTRYTVPAREPLASFTLKGESMRWQTAWERLPPDWPGAIMVLGIAALVPFVAAVLP